MSRWFVGSSRMRRCGALIATRLRRSRARSPPERLATVVSCLSKDSPNCASRERRIFRIERLDLVLMEPADLDAPFPLHLAGLERQRARDHFGEGRFAGAV